MTIINFAKAIVMYIYLHSQALEIKTAKMKFQLIFLVILVLAISGKYSPFQYTLSYIILLDSLHYAKSSLSRPR